MPLTKVLHNKLIHCIFFCLPTVQTSISVSIFIQYSIIIEAITDTRACLKNHSCHLHAPLCVIFAKRTDSHKKNYVPNYNAVPAILAGQPMKNMSQAS